MVYQLTTRDINLLIVKFNPETRNYEKKEIIKTVKHKKDKIFLILEGVVYLCAENDNFDRSILKVFTRGDFLSYPMLLTEEHGACYFVAKKPVKAVYFDKKQTLGALSEDEDLYEKISGAIGEQFENDILTHCFILQQKTIRGKLKAYFKNESLRQQSEKIKVPIPYSDLADYLGVDRSAMMKELTKLKSEGLIEESSHKRISTFFD